MMAHHQENNSFQSEVKVNYVDQDMLVNDNDLQKQFSHSLFSWNDYQVNQQANNFSSIKSLKMSENYQENLQRSIKQMLQDVQYMPEANSKLIVNRN